VEIHIDQVSDAENLEEQSCFVTPKLGLVGDVEADNREESSTDGKVIVHNFSHATINVVCGCMRREREE
jgi:hypothetical protein